LKAKIKIIKHDITLEKVDIITNPANPALRHRGGLAGSISREAGPKI